MKLVSKVTEIYCIAKIICNTIDFRIKQNLSFSLKRLCQ